MMRAKRAITLLLLFLICICAACGKDIEPDASVSPGSASVGSVSPESASVDNIPEQEGDKKFYELPEGIQNVMLGNGEFFDVEQDRTFTKDSFQVELLEDMGIYEVEWLEFIISDLDHDGEKELIFMLANEGMSAHPSIRIFDEQDGVVYSYAFVYRAVLELNDEGMIRGSSGAADADIYTLEFHGKEYKETVVAKSETKSGKPDPQYFLRGKAVSEKEFFDFCAQYNQSIVPWEQYENAELE